MPSTHEPVPCILCGGSAAVEMLERITVYDILYCRDCALRFSNPMSHPGGSYYEESHLYKSRISGNVSLTIPALDWRCRKLFQEYPPVKNERMLDIGSGDGGLMARARELGVDTYGVEIDPRGVQIARQIRGLGNVEGGDLKRLETLGWKDFDRVTCFEVMEHLPDPKGLLRLIFSLLRPGGLACITVPRWDRNPAFFDPETDYPPHHFTLWTAKSLERIFAQAGFEPATVLKAPLLFQNFFYLWQARRDASRAAAAKAADMKAGTPAHTANTATAPESDDDAPLRVNRKRLAIKTAAYTAFNAVNPVLRVAFPRGRGATLLAVARKPG
jgi:SAM-dependent methyltransferase